MLVILRENVEDLGRIGDVVTVSDGYARNFLLPQKWVVQADESNVKQIKHHQKQLEKKKAAQKKDAQDLAKLLSEFSCNIVRKVGENDRLFGSVGVADIYEQIKKAGYKIEKRMIMLEHPLKTLGVHSVTIKLEPEVQASVKVWIVKDEQK